MRSLTDRFLRAAWFGGEPLAFEPAMEMTDEFLDWFAQADLARPRAPRPGSGWVTVRAGTGGGWLIGGNIETICWHLKWSTFWPDLTDAILFRETSEDVPAADEGDASLTDLEHLGVFAQINGLVVGRPIRYPPDQIETLWSEVREHSEARASRSSPMWIWVTRIRC